MSNYLQASDVFLPEFIKRLQAQGLEIVNPNRIKSHIFKFDEKGNPTAMMVRARTAKAYRVFSGGMLQELGGDGSGSELWIRLPKIGDGDPANLRQFMTPKYSGSKPKESGQQGRLGPDPKQPTYGSGWHPEESSVPELGSTGDRGPQSGGEAQVTPAMPEDIEGQEDEALDDNINDKAEWGATPARRPSHLDVNIKESILKLQYLHGWLVKNGHAHEACKIRKLL
jgi:hypothetical protein